MLSFRHLAATLIVSFAYPCVALVAQPAQVLGKTQLSELKIAVASAPRTLNPAIATDAAGARILQLTHPALLTWNNTYQPVGLVAQGCTQPTLTNAICTLPADRTFTDGTLITAPILANWFTQLQSNTLSPFTQLKNVSVTALTSSTLSFTLPTPTLGFLGQLAEIPLANPISPTVGAGPYRIDVQDTLGAVTLHATQPNIPEKMTFTPISDATTRLLKLKKGEVDAVLNDLPPQLVEWAKSQGFPVMSSPGTSYSYIGLNHSNTFLARPEVREAMAMALNRPALRKFLLGNLAEPATTLLPPTHPAAWHAPEEPFDPFTAENLLDDAGLLRGPDNIRFSLTLLTSTDPFSQRVSQAIQSQLQAVGINVQLRPMEWATFYDNVKKGNFDAVMLAWTGEQQPAFYFHAFHSTQIPPVGLNRGRLNNPEADSLTTDIMAATSLATQTQATIATQKVLASIRPYLPLYRRHQVLITSPQVSGCTLPASGAYTGLITCRTK